MAPRMLISTELRFERRANVGLQGANSEVYVAWDHQLNAELIVETLNASGSIFIILIRLDISKQDRGGLAARHGESVLTPLAEFNRL